MYFDLPFLHQIRKRCLQLFLHMIAQCRRYFYNVVLNIFKYLFLKILEIEQYWLCSTSCTGSSFYYSYWIFAWRYFFISSLCLVNIVCNGHTIVRLEYLRGSQPSIFRISLKKLLLIIIKANQSFEVNRGW